MEQLEERRSAVRTSVRAFTLELLLVGIPKRVPKRQRLNGAYIHG